MQLPMFEGNEIMILLPGDVTFKFKGDFLIRAKDVAVALEYMGEKATTHVLKFCKGDQIYHVNNSNLLNRNVRRIHNTGEKFITNLGLNRVFGKSEQPKAEPFQDELYDDILPSIQKHGGYLTPEKVEDVLMNPDTIIQLATQLKEARARNESLTNQIEKQQPLADFAELCMQSDKSIKVRELAHMLSSHGIKIGEKRLYDKLREWKYIEKVGTEPTQRSIEQELFEVATGVKQKPSGEPFTWRTPYVTSKGQMHIANRLKREGA